MKFTVNMLLAALIAQNVCAEPENMARGKPYTFSTPPSYALCTDAGDKTQLTDGEWLKPGSGGFWTKKSVVGWHLGGVGDRMVTVDLGRDEPITGFSWNFGAGSAGVSWPDLIFVYVSTDGKTWRFAGDLYGQSKEENGPPNEDGFGIYRAWSVKMPCHGRYVTFLARATNYLFVDEVEVYRGPASCLTLADEGVPIARVLDHYAAYRRHQHFYRDAIRIGQAAQNLPEAARLEVVDGLHRLNAVVMRGKGYARPFLWSCDRWASADMLDLPSSKAEVGAPLVVEMMRGETRSAAVNLSNPTKEDLEISVSLEGFPSEAHAQLREVVNTVVKSGARVGGLLMGEGSTQMTLKVPVGTTRQLWISFAKPSCAAGDYAGRIVAGAISMPLTLKLAAVDFPARPRLHVGGWDYTENGGRQFGKGNDNLKARLARMAEFFTDTPWAGSSVLPQGAKFDAEGNLANGDRLDFRTWNDWVDLWGEQARQYCVFMNVPGLRFGEKLGTARFNRMVGTYMRAWYEGIRARLNGRRVVLLLLDEPSKVADDEIIIAWAKAIKAAVPEFVIFEDVDYADFTQPTHKAVYEVSDIICPASPSVTARGNEAFFREKVAEGKKLWLYSCCGPSRTFDPIVYYRSQAWLAWKLGAKATQFWAFGCGGGIGDSFRPFDQPGTEYSPFFVSPTNAFRAKQSEAILESVEDYEYLAMLAEKIAAEKAQGKDVAALEKLLAEAPGRALPQEAWLKSNTYSFSAGAKRYDWFIRSHDHAAMDAVRIEILHALAH